MLRIITYDIENDRLRTKTAKLLLRQGFERLQFSVFIGEIESDKWKTIWKKLQQLAEKDLAESDQICSFIIAPEQFRNLLTIGSAPDVEYIMGEKTVLYL